MTLLRRNVMTLLCWDVMTDLLVDNLLHHLAPWLRHNPAVLLIDCVADLGGDGEALLLGVWLAVLGEDSLALGLRHHLAVILGAALLLQHGPAEGLRDSPTHLRVL